MQWSPKPTRNQPIARVHPCVRLHQPSCVFEPWNGSGRKIHETSQGVVLVKYKVLGSHLIDFSRFYYNNCFYEMK